VGETIAEILINSGLPTASRKTPRLPSQWWRTQQGALRPGGGSI